MRHSSKRRTRRPRLASAITIVMCVVAVLAIGVFAASCGSATTTTTAAPPATGGVSTTAAAPGTTAAGGSGGAQIVLKNFAFDPADVTIKVGESVTWTNQDSATHTVVADNNEFKSSDLATGATFSFTFAKAGTYPYHCSIHPTMKGTITVQ